MKSLSRKIAASFLSFVVLFACLQVSAQKRHTVSKQQKNKQLMAAVQNEDAKKVALLLKQGADPNYRDEKDFNTSVLLTAAWWKNNLGIVKLLVENGADLNQENDLSITPLHPACFNKNIEMVKYLLSKGADVKHKDARGGTLLFDALALGEKGEKPTNELVSILLQGGIDVNAQSDNGSTVLMTFWEPEIFKLLIKAGADPNLTDAFGNDALEHARIYENKEKYDFLKPYTRPLDERRAKLPGKFLKLGDMDIYYKVTGAKTGTPLFVLHGGPAFDHQYFLTNSVFEEIGKKRPVVFFDQRGSGNSGNLTASQKAGVKIIAEDIERLRKHLGYEKIDILGHSWGGFLGMAYSVEYPESVSKLILCDSMHPVFGKDESNFGLKYPEISEKRIEARNGALGYDIKATREYIRLYLEMLFHSEKKKEEFLSKSDGFTFKVYTAFEIRVRTSGTDLTEDLKKSKIPTLILHGVHDDNITLDTPAYIKKTIPNSKLLVFEESGHMPFVEEPERFVRAIDEFLSS